MPIESIPNLKIIHKNNKIKQLLTKNLVKGTAVYGEKLIRMGNAEYRVWDPERSKLAAGIFKGLNELTLTKNSTILYLGAATGTTVSHLSDIVVDGFIFAVEFSPFVMYNLVLLAEKRKNILPILADANKPEQYYNISLASDLILQDVAQPNQVDIFLKNVKIFLKTNGQALLSVKARSIDVSSKPGKIFSEVKKELSEHFNEVKQYTLSPFEKDHALFYCKNFKR